MLINSSLFSQTRDKHEDRVWIDYISHFHFAVLVDFFYDLVFKFKKMQFNIFSMFLKLFIWARYS
jgi:hypothetical protein